MNPLNFKQMKQIKKVLSIVFLCTTMLFFSKNANAQCGSFNVTAVQTADGPSIGDAAAVATVTGSASGTGVSYYWYNSAQNIVNYGYNAYSLPAGTFCVIATDTSFGSICKDTFCLTITDTGTFNCANFNANTYHYDSCFKNDILVGVLPYSGSGNYSYSWNTGTTGSSALMGVPTGTYTCTITDNVYGCVKSVSISVVDDTCNFCDSFNLSGYISENDGCSTNDINLTVEKLGGSGNYSYLWDNSATTRTISNKSAGTYSCIITDLIYGCKDTMTITVSDDLCNPCSNFSFYLFKHDSCLTNDIVINSYVYNGSGNYSYLWSTGSTTNSIINQPTGWYKVTITDLTLNCVKVDSIFAVDTNFKCCKANFGMTDNGSPTKYFNAYYEVNTANHDWIFGDATTGTGGYTSHTYGASGVYTVCHIISTNTGCKDTMCTTINAPAPGKNLKVTHFGIPYIVSNGRSITIIYQNIGTTTENGIVEYSYPAGMSLTNSTVTPSSNVNNKLTFNVGSLTPGASGSIYLTMSTPSSYTLGSIKCDTAIILTIAGDIDVANNTSYDCDSVVSSWDPNDKMANPSGLGPNGNINPATKEINYLINFQNEGNWRTYRVRVEDEIDPSFDINSLMIGDASHEYRLVKSGRKLTWHFDNIELTPKSQNEKLSKGYIQYTLKLNNNLPLGTQLKNTAYIYFDANPAIITNTTKNTLKNADANAAVRDMNQVDLDFDSVLQDERVVITSVNKMDNVRIYDLNGKLIVDQTPKAMKAEINTQLIANSIYIIHVDMGDNTVVKKFQF